MPTIEHISDERLEQIEEDMRGMACRPDVGYLYDQKQNIHAIRRERNQRGERV